MSRSARVPTENEMRADSKTPTCVRRAALTGACMDISAPPITMRATIQTLLVMRMKVVAGPPSNQ
jgi:hypothetical protein